MLPKEVADAKKLGVDAVESSTIISGTRLVFFESKVVYVRGRVLNFSRLNGQVYKLATVGQDALKLIFKLRSLPRVEIGHEGPKPHINWLFKDGQIRVQLARDNWTIETISLVRAYPEVLRRSLSEHGAVLVTRYPSE